MRQSGCTRLLFGDLDEAGGDVDAEHGAGRADGLCELLRRVAKPAADVQHAVARGRRVAAQSLIPMRTQALDDEMPVLHEAVEQDPFQASSASRFSGAT